MRNRYPGLCYRCGMGVAEGAGHFERFRGGWRLQHASCAILHRGKPDPARQALNHERLKANAAGTGKRAQRARQKIRQIDEIPYNIEDF